MRDIRNFFIYIIASIAFILFAILVVGYIYEVIIEKRRNQQKLENEKEAVIKHSRLLCERIENIMNTKGFKDINLFSPERMTEFLTRLGLDVTKIPDNVIIEISESLKTEIVSESFNIAYNLLKSMKGGNLQGVNKKLDFILKSETAYDQIIANGNDSEFFAAMVFLFPEIKNNLIIPYPEKSSGKIMHYINEKIQDIFPDKEISVDSCKCEFEKLFAESLEDLLSDKDKPIELNQPFIPFNLNKHLNKCCEKIRKSVQSYPSNVKQKIMTQNLELLQKVKEDTKLEFNKLVDHCNNKGGPSIFNIFTQKQISVFISKLGLNANKFSNADFNDIGEMFTKEFRGYIKKNLKYIFSYKDFNKDFLAFLDKRKRYGIQYSQINLEKWNYSIAYNLLQIFTVQNLYFKTLDEVFSISSVGNDLEKKTKCRENIFLRLISFLNSKIQDVDPSKCLSCYDYRDCAMLLFDLLNDSKLIGVDFQKESPRIRRISPEHVDFFELQEKISATAVNLDPLRHKVI